MNERNELAVLLGTQRVGTLALTKQGLAAFAYDPSWLSDGFSISPLSLPLNESVFVPRGEDPFDGLFGVFADSLPDGWGRLLTDRLLRRERIDPANVNGLTRLSMLGGNAMGALRYEPAQEADLSVGALSLDEIARECQSLFEHHTTEDLDTLFLLGGSSGGARPKVFYPIDGEDWIVKFSSSLDAEEIGVQEYEYSLCAKRCGITMPETRLLPSKQGSGYFAVRRFDREGSERFHTASVAGLLETSHRVPNLDYHTLMQLTLKITNDFSEAEELYRRMCFNVYAHNRDDHSKNFSFLYRDGSWRLSPAYDLTYSNSIGGEHAMTVNGNGTAPQLSDLLAVAKRAKLKEKWAKETADEIRTIVEEDLRDYLT